MTSIQTRLSLWLLGSVVLLVSAHWLVTSRAPVVFTEEYIATRLEHDAEALISGIHFEDSGLVELEPEYIAPIYLRLNSGHYYLIQTEDSTFKSRSLGDESLNLSVKDQPHKSLLYHSGPFGQKLLAWVAHYEKDGRPISVVIAEELTTLDQHINRFRLRFGLLTLALFALLVITQRQIIRYSLKPLERMEQACRQLERGDIGQLPEDIPIEVKPLSNEINRMANVMQQRLVRSRNALGNLAHALKTPLALLTQLVEDENNGLDSESQQQACSSVSMIQSIINRELKRARLAGSISAGQVFHLNNEIPDMVGLLKKLYADKHLQYTSILKQDKIRFGDREDMLELLGNLLDNASKWAKRQVRLTVALNSELNISIEDDGPGIPASVQDSLTMRGSRYDESIQGHGLGLSIVQDIINQYGGAIRFSTSADLGGLKIDISLPTAT
ncbi:MAG: sensor histidine kinase [Gammaproteobacteria bacterium]